VNEFGTKGQQKTTLNYFSDIQKMTPAVSECSLSWHTADTAIDEVNDERRLQMTSPGFVSIQKGAILNICCNNGCNMSSFLTFSR